MSAFATYADPAFAIPAVPTVVPVAKPPGVLPANYKSLPLLSSIIPKVQHDNMTIPLNGKDYLVNLHVSIAAVKSVRFQGPGRVVFITGTGDGTGILTDPKQDHIVFDQIDFLTDKPFAQYGKAKVGRNALRLAGTNQFVNGCTFTDFDDAIFFTASMVHAEINDCEGFHTRGDLIYGAGARFVKLTRLRCKDGSTNEHVIRCELTEKTATQPPLNTLGGWLLIACDLYNGNGKEIVAARMADGTDSPDGTNDPKYPNAKPLGIMVNGGRYENPAFACFRVGQVVPKGGAPVPKAARNFQIFNADLWQGAYASVQYDQGSGGGIVAACRCHWNGHPLVAFNGPYTDAHLMNNVILCGGKPWDKRTYTCSGMRGAPTDVVTETGTVVA